MGHDYFEGILQLRNPNAEAVRYIHNQFRKNSKEWISNVVELKSGGIDFYVSSNRFLKILGRRLKNAFKGELKLSKKIYSINRQTSKNVYRGTVMFKLE